MALRAFSIAELLDMPKPTWLVEGHLPEGGFLAIYGEPESAKTFVALDIALCVATGLPWHGHAVRKSYVIYISAEGGGGIAKRVGAWLAAHDIEPKHYDTILASFVISTIAVHPESADMSDLITSTVEQPEYLAELEAYLAEDEDPPPPLIVVDTLARCFVGNENQQEDMGAFVSALDGLRERHAASVLVIHHTNKEGTAERGNTAFRGACDTMMKVVKKGMDVRVECGKQKDAEHFAPLDFELVVDPQWESCTLTHAAYRRTQEMDEKLDAVREYCEDHPFAPVRQIADALGLRKSTVQDIKAKLKTPK